MEFVVCVDGAQRTQAQATGLKKWMWGEDPDAAKEDDWAEVLEVVKALRGPNARVLVIDRRNGGVFADSQLEKLAAEEAA